MFNQQYSLDQNNSQHSSQQSQTFLTVPRLIQQEVQAYQAAVVKKNVNFEDPNQLQKSEHKESLEEGEIFGSRLSMDRREFSNRLDEVEENYKSLKLFQIEMQNLNGKKLISKSSRKFSDQSDFALRKHSEQLRKASSSYYPNPSPKFNRQASPLLIKEQNSFQSPRWKKRWYYIVKFLSKLMSVQPNVLKKEHLLLIDDKAHIIERKCIIFEPQNIGILRMRQLFFFFYVISLLVIFWEFAFTNINIIFTIFFWISLLESATNYFIGINNQEIYTQDLVQIIIKYIYWDSIHIIFGLITIYYSEYFIIFQFLRIRRMYEYNRMLTKYFCPILLIHVISCIQCKLSLDQFLEEDNISIYIISFEWTIYQLTNSGLSELQLQWTIQHRILSIITIMIGYGILIYLIKLILEYKSTEKYKLSPKLKYDIQEHEKREKLKPMDFSYLKPEFQKQIAIEIFMPLLNDMIFSKEFKEVLCQKLQTGVFLNGTILQHSHQQMDKFLILIKGNVAECFGNKILTKNKIPLLYFYNQINYPLQIKCISESLIAYIDYQEFYQLIKLFSKDFEYYCMLRDNRKIICPCCGYRSHSFEKCKYVFYVPNFKELIIVHNTSEPHYRVNFYRTDGRNRYHALLNKIVVCITAIDFAIKNKLASETELTNDVMSRLQGSTNNFEDSILNDFQEEKSSRYSLYQKHGTVEVPKTIYSPQNTFSSQNYQSSIPPIKLEDREQSYNSKKFLHKQIDHSQTQNSIKVNLVKSTVSNELQVKRTPKQKQTSSSSSLNRKPQSTSILHQHKSQSASINPQSNDEEKFQIDCSQSYEYYYPAYNKEWVTNSINRVKNSCMSFN